MAFEVDTIDLSLRSSESGKYLTANVYYVDGVKDATGELRPLSMGELVMAICLARASEMEQTIIDLMNKLSNTTAILEALTEIETAVVDWANEQTKEATYNLSAQKLSSDTAFPDVSYYSFLTNTAGVSVAGSTLKIYGTASAGQMAYSDFITNVESKMDENNSFSQQKMIELQSQTAKRDQAYDMISNILKSLNSVLVGNANNI